MYDIQNRCIPDEIDLFYFMTCIITHNNYVIKQNINVSMFDILSVKEPHTVPLWDMQLTILMSKKLRYNLLTFIIFIIQSQVGAIPVFSHWYVGSSCLFVMMYFQN